MKRSLAAVLFFALACRGAFAQAPSQPADREPFVPQVGQAGKDVIWVPTPDAVVKRMLEMAKVGPKDFLVDLGSGDGRTVITAARDFGARAMGVEFNPKMVELSRKSAAQAGVSGRAEFRRADIFATDFSRATVVTMYLLPDLNLRLRPRILDMRPGTRIVSHSFSMAEWEPDATAEVEGHLIYHWVVPAKVAGHWRLEQPGGALKVTLTQNFQRLSGTARVGSRNVELKEVMLAGDTISFSLPVDGASRDYSGRVSGKAMQGTVKGGAQEAKWTARRS